MTELVTVNDLWSDLMRERERSAAAGDLASPAVGRAFASWAKHVDGDLRRSLARFASRVDVESVCQEALLRMYVTSGAIAIGEQEPLTGADASRRLVRVIARRMALNLIRKHRREVLAGDDDVPEPDPGPVMEPSDPLLRERLLECVAQLTGVLGAAMRVRLQHGHRPEDEQARLAGMLKNTFHQNIRRARLAVLDCLVQKGIALSEVQP